MIARRTPIKPKRPGTRRGELSPAEKEIVHDFAYARASGRCELNPHLHCCGGRYWPPEGGLRERGHLVHLRNRRMYGWGPENFCWGCPHGHSDLMHTKGMQVPKTYSELVVSNADSFHKEHA